MKRALAALSLCLACGLLRADPPPPSPIDAANDPAWRSLLARLANGGARAAPFEERRYFPFLRLPVLLAGEIRLSPGRGLSLDYRSPDPRIVIVDSLGLIVRDPRGAGFTAASGGREQAATALLLNVVRFDVPELQKTFAFSGRRLGDAWELFLQSRDPSASAGLSSISLSGTGASLSRIDLIVSPRQHVEILIGPSPGDARFSAGDLARYFR
jgi:hypothetical protein